MNKSDLIRAAADKDSSLSQAAVAKSLDALTEVIADSLAQGDPVQVTGFGTFDVRHHAARKGRNPQTGETIQIAASTTPGFKAGKNLKDRVKG